MKTTYLVTISLIAQFTSFSQPNLDGRYELGGSVSYSYSSMNFFGSSQKARSFGFSPKLGVFLTSAVEVFLGPSASFSFFETGQGITFINGVPFPVAASKSESYNLALVPGVSYHFLVHDVFVPYLAVSANLQWQRSISRSSFSLFSTKWSKPTIIAPTIDAGVRIFISQDWALRVGLIYSKTLQQVGDTNINGYNLALGTGFAIFL